MAKRSRKTEQSETELKEFVVVTLADNMEQAKDYETLLRSNDIPAVIKEQHEESIDEKGIAVMVPEESFDEAHVVIESQDAYDDFYDIAMEDDGDFNSDVFDDDF